MFRQAREDAATFANVIIPDESPQPTFDGDIAYCPEGHGQLVRSRNGNGWHCPKRCNFWWLGEGYTPSAATATDTATLDCIIEQAPTAPVINQTDLGNARRLVAQHGDKIRYVPAWGVFLVWNGSFWERDETGAVARLARDTVRAMYDEASRLDDVEARRSLAKWALASESRSRLENMVALAKDEPGISIKHSQLDANPWLLTCRNATVDLRTGTARPHSRDDLITKRIEVDYNPDAPCPKFERFLHRIMGGDMQLVTFLQRAAGYTLTGDTSEHCLFYLYGTGKNGKSTWSEILMQLMGAYALKTPTEMLMAKQYGGGIPNDVARLPGMRMALAAEVEEGKRLAEALVKDLTGGDTMTARFLREEFFDFKPTHKLWMYGNHKPVIRGTDDGIWRRFHLIPFNEWITPEEEDPHLKDKLVAELPGILAWAVRGCVAWRRGGLGVPQAVRDATTGYRNDMDVLGGFLSECTVRNARSKTLVAAMYAEYDKWCEANGEHAIKKRDFDTKLKERGLLIEKGGKNKAYWQGIALFDTKDRTPPPDRGDTREDEPEEEQGYQGYQGYSVLGMNESYKTSHGRYTKVDNPDNPDNPLHTVDASETMRSAQQTGNGQVPRKLQLTTIAEVTPRINADKIKYVLEKLEIYGPVWARGYMDRVEGFDKWPQRIQDAVQVAEEPAA
jgi:putative DNA primase/helicase